MNSKQPLLGKTKEEIEDILKTLDIPCFKAKIICKWIYKKWVSSFEQMTDLSILDRQKLGENYCIHSSAPIWEAKSVDGTQKFVFKVKSLQDNKTAYIETVYIPDNERNTICVSSQAGCKRACKFCATGKNGFKFNISHYDILNQFYSIGVENISNFVFMGMGEPFDNSEEVYKALFFLCHQNYFAFSPRRITVSSIGVSDKIEEFLQKSECNIAISLHNPFSSEREAWMPIEKVYPLSKLLEILKKYDFSHQRKLSFEYILFGKQNDDIRHAKELIRLLKPIKSCMVNLIPYNPTDLENFGATDIKQAFLFRDYLSSNGLFATIRKSRGGDIDAACGLLSGKFSED